MCCDKNSGKDHAWNKNDLDHVKNLPIYPIRTNFRTDKISRETSICVILRKN